jgi:short-subunit dehydrogenase
MSRPLALVTGASAGIGESFAHALARAGHDLVVVARRRDRLEALATRLGAAHGVGVEVVVADLATNDGIDAVVARAGALPLDLVVNNAGFGGYRPFVKLDPKVADQLVSVHIRASIQIARAALPGMVARDRGAIVNVASLLAYSGTVPPGQFLPDRAVYGGAKAFLLTFTQLLASELAGTKVRAQVCLPGLVKTEFHEVQGMDTSKMPPRMSPDDIAQASLAGLALGEVVCVPALEDRGAVERADEAQRAVLPAARMPVLAARYRQG